MNKRYQWLLIASLTAVVILVLAGCAGAAPEAAAPAEDAAVAEAPAAEAGEKVLIYGLSQEPELLNPLIRTQTAASEVAGFMEEGLLAIDPDGNYYAQLATEVPSLENGGVSEDGLTITYNLRDDILWSDGEPFTCDDVLFTYEAVSHPESGAVGASSYASVESVTCPDDYTAVVQYNEFFAPFLNNFGAIMPRHATGDPAQMTEWDYNWGGFMGTGPFKMQEWVQGDRVVLVKNENYRDYPDKPLLDKVIARIIPSREVGKALITLR